MPDHTLTAQTLTGCVVLDRENIAPPAGRTSQNSWTGPAGRDADHSTAATVRTDPRNPRPLGS